MQNTFTIDADIKKTSYFNQPTVTQNDDITFVVNISDDGQAFDLADVATVSLANTKPNADVVVTAGLITGTNQVTFVLGTNETAVSGRVEAVVQLYDESGRVSTLSFSYVVKVDPTGSGYVPSTDEQTLIEVVLNDGPLRIQEAIDAGVYATTQGDYALAQGDIAATESANLSTLKTDVQTATTDANMATINANDSAIYADTQGDYALAQGDYAKTEADRLVGTDVSTLDVRVTDNTTQLAEMANSIGDVFNVVGYGADNTGTTDSALTLNATALLAAGNILWLPKGVYKILSTLTIPDNTIVFAYGAKIFNTTSNITLLSLGNGVKIFGLELEGAGNITANANGNAVTIEGINSSDFKTDILIENCHIHDIGFYGIYAKFAKNINIKNTKIEHIGYAGVIGLSVSDMHISEESYIQDISPGQSSNAYGVSFSRIGESSDLVANPRSKDCSVKNCTILDIPLWEALDTHGGENISFESNTIRNCKLGIACVSASNDLSINFIASQNCSISNNKIYGTGTGVGINVTGNAIEDSSNCKISNNFVNECGLQGSNVSGGIASSYTKNLAITGNILNKCYANGIQVWSDNKGFCVLGNTISDTQDNSYINTSGIALRSVNNKGAISGNTLIRINDALNTYVAEIGINISTPTGNEVAIGTNFNNYVIELNGVQGQIVTFNSFGTNVDTFTGTATPEGSIIASMGSLFINKNGGAGTTLYVKQSGSGNTGWVGK